MRTLYVDNFRGFAKTHIDLHDINFFVGENSTGKSSLLWAAQLLADPQFWYALNFSAVPGGSGSFDDLVSHGAPDRRYFRIGLVDTDARVSRRSQAATQQSNFVAILLTFEAKEGRPNISECCYQVNGDWFQLKLNNAKGLATAVSDAPIPSDSRLAFDAWERLKADHTTPVKQITMNYSLPFIYALSDALRQHAQVEETSKTARVLRRSHRDIDSLLLSDSSSGIVWIAPIRTKPKRTYDEYGVNFSAEGEHTPYLIRRLLSRRSVAKVFKEFMTTVGRASGLFESVSIKRYGRGDNAPFELDIVLSGDTLGINNVGYGVSQSLPIFVELFARADGTRFAIQQPEVHLHPRAQAALGGLVCDLATEDSKGFLIETHSDYLIDRFRLRLKESARKPSAQIIFCERSKSGNVAHSMTIGADGSLPKDQPSGYRAFFLNEALNALDLS